MNRQRIITEINAILAAGNHTLRLTAADKKVLKAFRIDPAGFIDYPHPVYRVEGDTEQLRKILDRLDPIRKDTTGSKSPYLLISYEDAKL